MKHRLEQLTERMKFNREHNISFASDKLLAEVEEDLESYAPNTSTAVWCDPKDNFVKDYYVIDLELEDDEEREAANKDKAEFVKDKNPDDIYIITLSELNEVLEEQDKVL